MYCLLGNIVFEPLNITSFNETHAVTWAEHQVLDGKPRLQALGEQLVSLDFSLRLHHKMGGVERRYQELLQAQSQQQALALVWGRNQYKGLFVIDSIRSQTLFTDKYGHALCRELSISLKEFAHDDENEANSTGEAMMLGENNLLGSILPENIATTLSEIKAVVNKGVMLYQQGKLLVNEIQDGIVFIRRFIHEPSTVVAYLPNMLGRINESLGCFAEISGLDFSTASHVLTGVGAFATEVGEICQQLQYIKQEMEHHDGNAWINVTEQGLNQINNCFDVLAPRVAEMTAWIVVRADEEVVYEPDLS